MLISHLLGVSHQRRHAFTLNRAAETTACVSLGLSAIVLHVVGVSRAGHVGRFYSAPKVAAWDYRPRQIRWGVFVLDSSSSSSSSSSSKLDVLWSSVARSRGLRHLCWAAIVAGLSCLELLYARSRSFVCQGERSSFFDCGFMSM
jgi:hypothetical protein